MLTFLLVFLAVAVLALIVILVGGLMGLWTAVLEDRYLNDRDDDEL